MKIVFEKLLILLNSLDSFMIMKRLSYMILIIILEKIKCEEEIIFSNKVKLEKTFSLSLMENSINI